MPSLPPIFKTPLAFVFSAGACLGVGFLGLTMRHCPLWDNTAEDMSSLRITTTLEAAARVRQLRVLVRNEDTHELLAKLVSIPRRGSGKSPSRSMTKVALLTTVRAGRYRVFVEPADAQGHSILGCMGSFTPGTAPLELTPGSRSDSRLSVRCRSTPPASLQAHTLINHAPSDLELRFVDRTLLRQGSFTCDHQLTVCAQASDVDKDPLRFELKLPGDHHGCVAHKFSDRDPLAQSDKPSGVREACYKILCPPSFNGRLRAKVAAYDQAWRENAWVDIESVHAGSTMPPRRSHTKFMFQGHFLASEQCQRGGAFNN